MFIGGLSWQTTQGERARERQPARQGTLDPPGAPEPDTPARPCALLTPGAPAPSFAPRPGTPRAQGDRRARTAQRVEGRR